MCRPSIIVFENGTKILHVDEGGMIRGQVVWRY